MKRNQLLCLLVAASLCIGVAPALAEFGEMTRHDGKSGIAPLARLDLSADQIEKIRNLRLSHEEAMAPLVLKADRLQAELRVLWLQMKPDTGMIASIQKAIHDVRFDMLKEQTSFRIAMRNVLTDQQLSRFLALGIGRQQFMDDRGHGRCRPKHPVMGSAY